MNSFKGFKRALDKSFITGFSAGIFGAGGAGKTSFIKMLPPEQTLYIAIDDSSHPIRDRNFFHVALPKPLKENPKAFVKELNDVYTVLRTDKNCQIRYVVIDSISELERYFQMMSIASRNNKRSKVELGDEVPVQKDYGDASILTYKYLIQFRDLKTPTNTACGKAINTFFIANEMSQEVFKNDTNSRKKIVPFLTEKMAGKFRDAVDILGYMHAEGNGERYLNLNPSQEIEAKNRFKNIGSMKIPFDFDIMTSFINPIKQEIAQTFKLGNK